MHPLLSHRTYLNHRASVVARDNNYPPMKDGVLQRWSRAITNNWKRRKMIGALRAMDDRLLRDIGIYRNDIERVVDGFNERELRIVPIAPLVSATLDDFGTQRRAA